MNHEAQQSPEDVERLRMRELRTVFERTPIGGNRRILQDKETLQVYGVVGITNDIPARYVVQRPRRPYEEWTYNELSARFNWQQSPPD